MCIETECTRTHTYKDTDAHTYSTLRTHARTDTDTHTGAHVKLHMTRKIDFHHCVPWKCGGTLLVQERRCRWLVTV